MKNFLALLVVLFAFTACQKELNFNTPPQSNAACKACSYIPFCSGSVYAYIDTSFGTGATVTDTIKIIKDSTIDGKVFQKFANAGADGFYNCSSGVSTVIAYSVPSAGGVVTKLEQTLLKANSPVGTTWNNIVTIGGQNVNYKYTLTAKGLTRTVLGVTYNDVIQVHLTLSITVPIIGTISAGESDYYYANNIGLIENTMFIDQLGTTTMTYHRVLKTYSIP